MNPTLTKASEALRESLADWQGNGDLPTFAVIAVLEAIREPDDEMLEAGTTAGQFDTVVWRCGHGDETGGCDADAEFDGAVSVWQAMIDSITNSNPTANHGSGE